MKLTTTIIVLLSWNTLGTAYLASFYGDSFLFQSTVSFISDTTSVSLRFQTSSSDGILFLAVGHDQYLLIELSNGKLEVKVNLGHGEEIFSTPEDKSLNNLIWHEFKVIRSRNNIKLVLNRNDVLSDQILTEYHGKATLNLDFGVFIGGIGGNVTLPHGIRPSKFYRGCLLSAEINGRDLLSPLTNIPNERILYNVLPGCPKIFQAGRSEPFTFEVPSSYIATRRWTTQEEGTFECAVKTIGETGIILYNAGRGRGEFIGLEMVDGVIGASVNKGGGVVALHTVHRINDGSWHTIRFSYSPSYLDIIVDGNQTKAFVEQTDPLEGGVSRVRHHNLDLAGHLYIGGIPRNVLEMSAVPHSLISLSSSKDDKPSAGAFPGCMKNIRINHRRKGFSDFLISNKISAGCTKKKFEKESINPVEDYESTNRAVSDLFAVFEKKQREALKTSTTTTTTSSTTTQATTTKPAIKIPNLKITTEILVVAEGSSRNLTHSELSVSDALYGEKQIEILFIISTQPSHGFFTRLERCESNITITEFTMQDIQNNFISYCHDGSETENDVVEFSLVWDLQEMDPAERTHILSQLAGQARILSFGIALNNGSLYSLPIVISPVNDLPSLHIPVDYLFQPVKRTKTHLPVDILKATDPDSPPSQIAYVLLGNLRSANYHIENERNPGHAVSYFTQEDVNSNRMVFVHEGDVDNARLILRLTNVETNGGNGAMLTSSKTTAVLRIAAVPINITVFTKKITLLDRSSTIFEKQFLSATSNAEPGAVDFEYVVKEMPSLGIIQVMDSTTDSDVENWVNKTSFTDSQLSKGYVRYKNVKTIVPAADVEKDKLIFTVRGAGSETPSQTLRLKIQKVKVTLTLSPVDLVNGSLETVLTDNVILVEVKHLNTTSDLIKIRVTKAIDHVSLLYNDIGTVIEEEDCFTLEEMESGRVTLRVDQEFATQSFESSGEFVAVANDVHVSDPALLEIIYEPDLKKIQLLNKGVLLLEGGENVIDSTMLKASFLPSPETATVNQFLYSVTHNPMHGSLMLSAGKDSYKQLSAKVTTDGEADMVTKFTSLDLETGKVLYRHDDSESTTDNFGFRVVPVLDDQPQQTITRLSDSYLDANFTIKIKLVNDEKPVRVVHSTFQVVRHGERLMTEDDIWFHDADTDFDDLDLVYVRRGIVNGQILNATDARRPKLYKFTQRDILDRKVLFKHGNDDFGRFVLWVNDGKYLKTGVILVYASDPFVKIKNSSQLVVLRNQGAAITSANLWTSTNVKGCRDEIIYRITTFPSHGKIHLNDTLSGGRTVSNFTQQDIYNRTVFYQHDGSSFLKDFFEFEVSAGETTTNGSLGIVAFLETYQDPPKVENNRTIVVEEGMRAPIRKMDLRIVHSDTDALDMQMIVTKLPKMGYLTYVENSEVGNSNFEPVENFTQADVDDGLLWYIHNSSNSSGANGKIIDYFTFEVTNGFYTLHNLRVNFDIVPNVIPLRVSNFSILEGGSIAIAREYLNVAGSHYGGSAVEFNVTQPPLHGLLETDGERGEPRSSFLLETALDGHLYYTHDGSETLEDMFCIQAFTTNGKKQSEIETMYITIVPDNDQLPRVVNNTGMKLWINSTTEITNAMLGSIDNDTGPDHLNYGILPPSNGWVAFKGNTTRPVVSFTQWDVDNRMVVFVHQGASTGGFTFQVDDGVNFTPKSICVITAKLLLLTLKKNEGIKVFPGASVPITADALHSETNDDSPGGRIILYTVTDSPKLGKIMKKSSPDCEDCTNAPVSTSSVGNLTEARSFTQDDIDHGNIVFVQEEELISSWSEMDYIVLNVSSPPATNITGVKIMVTITYDAFKVVGKSGPIGVNKGLTVIEGGKFVIKNDVLDARNLFKKLPSHRDKTLYELRYSITKLPLHGNLSISGRNVTILNTTFTQKNMITGRVAYTHDHSDTMKDSFGFDVYLIDKKFSRTTGRLWVVPKTFYSDRLDVTISPLNDNPPKLMTKGKSLLVIDGFVTPVLRSVLYTADPDNSPDEITYTLIREPSRGKLVLSDAPSDAILKFTQADVDNEKVLFVPHGATLTTSGVNDALYFSVTDGTQRPLYNLFQIKIVPVFVHFLPMPMEIPQGLFSLVFTTNSLNVSTNGNYSLITFRILKPPQSGVILVNETEASLFSYDDVVTNGVRFAMVNNQFSRDDFEIAADYNRTSGENISVSFTIHITVTPLSAIGSPSVSFQGLTRLGLSVLNATALSKRTSSMPVYNVVKPPFHGNVVKVFPPTNGTEEIGVGSDLDDELADGAKRIRKRDLIEYSDLLQEVDTFTHDDVAMGYVFVHVPYVNVSDKSSVADGMILRLTVEDDTVQPAEFDFNFEIVPTEAEDYSSFFDQFLVKETESPTEYENKVMEEVNATNLSEDTLLELPTQAYFPPAVEQTAPGLAEVAPKDTIPKVPKDMTSESGEPRPAEASTNLPWVIPVAVVVALLIILLIIIVVLWYCRRAPPKEKNDDEIASSGGSNSQQPERNSRADENAAPFLTDDESKSQRYSSGQNSSDVAGELLLSPACPEVTVRLLNKKAYPPDMVNAYPPVSVGHQPNFGLLSGSVLHTRVLDLASYGGDPSLAYVPPGVYEYEDIGSAASPEGPDFDFYAMNGGGSFDRRRLYHTQSDKLLDPSMLSRFSSEESVPSVVNDQYASPGRVILPATTSVPSGLNRPASHRSPSKDPFASSRSTASLTRTGISPELTLLPSTGLEEDQYWI